MKQSFLRNAEKYKKQNERRRIWQKIVRAMACVVVFCTTYMLILPAITLEKSVCDLSEHTHSESCYKKVTSELCVSLVCTYESLGVHAHTEECYDEEENLICGQADYVVHEHDTACVDDGGEVLCQIPEIEEHEHTEECYRPAEPELYGTETGAAESVHFHNDDCYTTERGALTCQIAETEGHSHGQTCYTQGKLTCQLPEQTGHTHGKECSETVLNCDLTVEPHEHGDGCYEQVVCELTEGETHTHSKACEQVLRCDLTEQPHTHKDTCYQTNSLCDKPESEGHTHGTSCYESLLTCKLTETAAHLHTDDCYEKKATLICKREEGTPEKMVLDETETPTLYCEKEIIKLHSHEDDCYETYLDEDGNEQERLICTELIVLEHVHDESCFVTEEVAAADIDTLTCTITEGHVHALGCSDENGILTCEAVENHVHGDMCYGTWKLSCGQEEHTHNLYCRNDPEADVEEEADWTASFADAEKTGDWSADVVSIARTQLGYTESTRNYAIMDDGETTRGYTRYGAWYGEPYSDWNTLFVMFCLNYGGVQGVPMAEDAQQWLEKLAAEDCGLYRVAAEWQPSPGQIVFLSHEPVRMGIVDAVEQNEDGTLVITIIEGDADGKVQQLSYGIGEISGYVDLAEAKTVFEAGHVHTEECYTLQLNCTWKAHEHDENCYKPDGSLICQIDPEEVHEHSDACYEKVLTCTVGTQPAETYLCGLEEHSHSDSCLDENGGLVCGLEEHAHSVECKLSRELSQEDRAAVAEVITLIEPLSTYEEIMAKLDEFYEADDTEGEEIYMMELYTQVETAYRAYMALREELRTYVTNADKLMGLEFIWSRITLEGEIVEASVDYDPLPYAAESTKIYLFDYGPLINTKVTGQGMGYLPFYRTFPEYSYTVDGAERNDYDRQEGGNQVKADAKPPILNNVLVKNSTTSAVNTFPNIALGVNPDQYPNSKTENGSWLTQSGSLQYLFDPTYSTDGYIGKDEWLVNIRADSRKNFYNPYTHIGITSINQAHTEDANAGADNSAYLFRRAYLPVENKNGSGTGLFQKDGNGYWYYDSGQNAAWYNPETEKFELYNYTVIPGHESFDIYGGTTNGNFLPFNKAHKEAADEETNFPGGEGRPDYQTSETLVQYDNGNVRWDKQVTADVDDWITSKSGTSYKLLRENYRLITSNRTNSVNLNFGMVVEFDFYMPEGGMIDGNNDGVKEAMEFVFKGDDDVWVFIDDVLVLDIGGCHDAQEARINFATGRLTQPGGAGYHKPGNLKDAFKNAGITTGFTGNTFSNFTRHTLKFFYMERGGNVSFCRLKFNMPQLPKNNISVKKELASDVTTLGNPDYTFAVMALENGVTNRLFLGRTDNYSVIKKTKYRIKDIDGNYLINPEAPAGTDNKLFSVDEYGIFKLKAGQTAIFEEVPATDVADFYVQEMIKDVDMEQYMTYKNQQYSSDIRVNNNRPIWQGKITWENRGYFNADTSEDYDADNPETGPYGHVWYGASGPITDANTNSSSGFAFQHQNGVYEDRLAKLSITKIVTGDNNTAANRNYKINVELDGDPLPTGTNYTLIKADDKEETRTVGFDADGNSYVELAGGETAVISNILSGTKFRVWESEQSAKGHAVTYSNASANGNGENIVVNSSDGITGTIRVYDNVDLIVVNSPLNIPVTKSFHNFADGAYTYTFTMKEMVLSEEGIWTVGKTLPNKTVTINSATTTFNFDELTYYKHEFGSFPAKKYYLIEETGETSPTLDNTMQYLVEVTITENSKTGVITAKITNILQRSSADGTWEDKGAAKVEFVNTLTGSLTVTKTVKGGSLNMPTTGFEFTLTLASGDSGTTPGNFTAKKTAQNGTQTQETLKLEPNNKGEYSYTFQLKHNESITFTGLPVGTNWTVKEKENAAFIQSWTVGATSGTGTESNGMVTLDGTTAAYTNNSVYELPETGGTGTTVYTMAGLLLICFSTAYLMYRSKARRREVF